MRAWSAGGRNLRRGQSLGGKWRRAGLREGMVEIICLTTY